MSDQNKRIESGSSLSTFRTCARKYSYTYEDLLEPVGYPPNLIYGSLIHAEIAERNSVGIGAIEVERLTRENLEFLNTTRNKYPLDGQRLISDQALARGVANEWGFYWLKDQTNLSQGQLIFQDVEKEWSLPLVNGTHVGKRDGLVRHRTWDKLFLYELKTASDRSEDNYIQRLRIDHQISSNLLALREQGLPVAGVIYDIIWKPALRKKKANKTNAQDETDQEFNARIIEEYKTTPENYFQRVVVERDPKELNLWKEELEEQFCTLNAQKVRYRNPSACMTFGKLCPFFSLCDSSDPRPPEEIRAQFNTRPRKLTELQEVGG